MSRRQGRRNIRKLPPKVGELDLVILQRCVIEHFRQGFRGRFRRQLIFRLAGHAIPLRLRQFRL